VRSSHRHCLRHQDRDEEQRRGCRRHRRHCCHPVMVHRLKPSTVGLAGSSPRVRLRPLSAGLRLVASLFSGWRVLMGGA
jgi:hypothetical protein